MITSMNYQALIRDVADFPIPGVLFRDVSPLLQSPEAFAQLAVDFAKMIDLENVDLFLGIESRGFIFAAMLAAKFNKGFLPLRKAGKLPPPVIQESYQLEYGQATLEIAPSEATHKKKVIICDDVLATGGTLKASISLCEKAGYEVEDILVLINLTFINQMTFKKRPIKSLIQY